MRPGDPGSPEWLATHAIDPDVWAERGSWRYETDDVDDVLAAVEPFLRPTPGVDEKKSLTGSRNWIGGVVKQCGGLVIPKTPPPGAAPIPPQLRPDGVDDPDNPGKKLPVVTDHRPGPYQFHGELADDDDWPTTPVKRDGTGGRPLMRQHVWETDNVNFPRHLEKHHGGVNTNEVHRREDGDRAKYLFLPNSNEARIDVHPRALEMIANAERVFFVLEGALKNDAVLSAGEAVFSVPSVTLWRSKEDKANSFRATMLQEFARQYLQGKMVFVVPDADWVGNPMVDWFALLVRTYLREALGYDKVYIAAPPVEFYEATGEKGVDDWLGTPGRAWAKKNAIIAGIDGLVIRGKEPGPEVLRSWPTWDFRESDWFGKGPRLLNDAKDYHALTLLSLLGPRHERSLGGLASVMDVSAVGDSERILPFLKRLHDWRAIRITGSLAWKAHEHGYYDTKTKTRKIMSRKDWIDRKERPMIEMRDGFEAYETPRTLLGDFWERENAARISVLEKRVERLEREQPHDQPQGPSLEDERPLRRVR